MGRAQRAESIGQRELNVEVGMRNAECGNKRQRAESMGQMTEDGRRKTDRRMTEGRRRKVGG